MENPKPDSKPNSNEVSGNLDKKRDDQQASNIQKHTVDLGDIESQSNISLNDPSGIQINVDGMQEHQQNQLKILKNIIHTARAYSIFYYNNSAYWSKIYFTTIFVIAFLLLASTMINQFFSSSSNKETIKNYNVSFNAIIAFIFAIISGLDASHRQRGYEEAGDEYKEFSQGLYNKVFLTGKPFSELDLQSSIVDSSLQMSFLTKKYDEPPAKSLKNIFNSDEFKLSIQFKHS